MSGQHDTRPPLFEWLRYIYGTHPDQTRWAPAQRRWDELKVNAALRNKRKP